MPRKKAPESREVGSKSPSLGATMNRPFSVFIGCATRSVFFGAGAGVAVLAAEAGVAGAAEAGVAGAAEAGGAAGLVAGAGAAGFAGGVWASAAAGTSSMIARVIFMVVS